MLLRRYMTSAQSMRGKGVAPTRRDQAYSGVRHAMRWKARKDPLDLHWGIRHSFRRHLWQGQLGPQKVRCRQKENEGVTFLATQRGLRGRADELLKRQSPAITLRNDGDMPRPSQSAAKTVAKLPTSIPSRALLPMEPETVSPIP